MDHSPKKSKALIITIIAIVILLIIGYFVFKNSESLFGTKNSTNISKVFAPLLGSSKPKDVSTINGATTNSTTSDNSSSVQGGDSTNGGTVATGTSGNNGGQGSSGTDVTPVQTGPIAIIPQLNPIATPNQTQTPAACTDSNGNPTSCAIDTMPANLTQCFDGIDNDGDHLIDSADPGCHTDFNAGNTLSYDKNLDRENRTANTTPVVATAMCPDDPLVFTEEEKAQLTTLLRQYYLLAPTLRIEDDITLLDYDNQTNEELVKQAGILTQDCQAQKANPAYTGPKEIKDNPYYQNPVAGSGASEYIPGYGLYELMFNIW